LTIVEAIKPKNTTVAATHGAVRLFKIPLIEITFLDPAPLTEGLGFPIQARLS
jgi:hypothetical protein